MCIHFGIPKFKYPQKCSFYENHEIVCPSKTNYSYITVHVYLYLAIQLKHVLVMRNM